MISLLPASCKIVDLVDIRIHDDAIASDVHMVANRQPLSHPEACRTDADMIAYQDLRCR